MVKKPRANDLYPLLNIDRLIDGASGHKYLSFMNVYSGYDQIHMHPDDEEKIVFITKNANFYYKVMPFGLKNVEATYQRLMNKIFAYHIGHNIKVYVDDMVAKTSGNENQYSNLA